MPTIKPKPKKVSKNTTPEAYKEQIKETKWQKIAKFFNEARKRG
jgi:hypothetical protein